jgi:CxxC-x17-CxxC domain-containing protein
MQTSRGLSLRPGWGDTVYDNPDEGIYMARRSRNFPRKSHKRRTFKRSFKVICARCGKEVVVEVAPPPEKELLCFDCYNK